MQHHSRIRSSSDVDNKACLEIIIKQAKCIELLLYYGASTYEEYIDRSTFPRRFITVIKTIKLRKAKERYIDEAMPELSGRFDSLWRLYCYL